MFISDTKFIVRYAETDQMGIVHHSNYPIWYEAGRTDFIRKMGMPYSAIEEKGILLPLVELKCSYKRAARYEDEITVKTSIKEFTGVRITFRYDIYTNNDPTVINCGETMHAWTNKEHRPLNIKKHAPEIFQLILEATKTNKLEE